VYWRYFTGHRSSFLGDSQELDSPGGACSGDIAQTAFQAYPVGVKRWSKRKYSFITAALAGLWLLFYYPVWHWLWYAKPEGVWAAVAGVGVLPIVLWYLYGHADREWNYGRPIRKIALPLGYVFLIVLAEHREAWAWDRLTSLGPLGLWAAVVAMVLVVLSASLLISTYTRE
jgi:hypothetical protein